MGFGAFLLERIGEVFNVCACAMITMSNLVLGISLRQKYRQFAENPELGHAPEGWRVLESAFSAWTAAWLLCFLLYIAQLSLAWRGGGEAVSNPSWARWLQLMSDVGSGMFLLVAYGMNRGGAIDRSKFLYGGCLLLFAIVLFDLWLIGLGELIVGAPTDEFLRLWSSGLAMMAAYKVGRAFKARYGTNTVWVLGVFYATLQPLAYGAAFALDSSRSSLVTVANQMFPTPGTARFVTCTQDANGRWLCDIRTQVGSVRMTRVELFEVLRILGDQIEWPTKASIYLQVRFEEVLFSVLALTKLAWASTVIATLRLAPEHPHDTLIRCSGENRPCVLKDWKWAYWPLIVSIVPLLAAVLTFYGVDLMIAVMAAMAPPLLALRLMKGGKTWAELLDKVIDRVRPPA